MGVKSFAKKVINKVKDTIQGNQDNTQNTKDDEAKAEQLKKWQDKFMRARTHYDASIMDEREAIYLGTHNVDGNINSSQRPNKRANNVYNMTYEFIESMADVVIPQPSVRCKREQDKEQAQTIEDSLKCDIQEQPIARLNDRLERTTPIQGFSLLAVSWNQNVDKHTYMGEIELQEIHPKQFIPQPNVYDLEDMDYYFILNSQTKQYIKKRYGVDVELEAEQYPEVNSIDSSSYNEENNKVTEIIAWYKDENGDIGRFVWCNDVTLEDTPQYFYRHIDGQVQTTETLTEDITKPTGEVIPAGTEVPYYVPTHYPLVVRCNVPKSFTFGGQSDVDVIRDQQDAIKKIISNIEEKLLRGSAIIKAQEDHNVNLTNQLYQVVKGNPQQLQMLGLMNLQADIGQDLEFAQYLYKIAQSSLGITDSFQGKADKTAKSGIAKQMLIQQAAGRMQSKQYNKIASYQELYRILFEFKLAFYDEQRPYLKRGDNNEDEYCIFSKYDFLEKDSAGEYYYNTDFIITSDGADLPRDKTWLMQQTLELYKMQTMTPSQLWQVLSSIGYPDAKQFFKQAQMQEQQAQQQQAQQQAMMQQQAQQQPQQQQKGPSESIAFKDLPPEGQVQMAAQAGIHISPQHIINSQLNQQQMQQANKQAQQPQQQQPNPNQPQPQQPQQIIQQLLSQLNPAEQQAFASASDQQKQAIIQQLIGGNQ